MKISPVLSFPLLWGGVLALSALVTTFGILDFNYLSQKIYVYIFSFSIFWCLGSTTASLLFKRRCLIYFFESINSFSFNRSIRIVSFVFVVSLIFKFLEIKAVTGEFNISFDNISLYRLLITEEGVPLSYNFINVFNPLIFSSLAFAYFCWKLDKKKSAFYFVFMFLVFSYLSTARSFVFLSLLILLFVININGGGLKLIILIAGLIFLSFGIVGYIVGKPGFEPFFIYLLAPIHAFDIIANGNSMDYPLLSFRPLHGMLVDLNLIDSGFGLLDYVETPYPVNVYTVFGVYYNDFGFYGVCAAMFLFSFISTFFYKSAMSSGSIRLQLISAFYMAYIVLGVFYDYYTSSFFALIAPFVIISFVSRDKL